MTELVDTWIINRDPAHAGQADYTGRRSGATAQLGALDWYRPSVGVPGT